MFVLVLCSYVRYYFIRLLGVPVIYVRVVCIPFYVILNICNFRMTFFIALSWILFSYLLTVSLIKFPRSIIVKNKRRPETEKIKKNIHNIFKENKLDII